MDLNYERPSTTSSSLEIGFILFSHVWNSTNGNQKVPTIENDKVCAFTRFFRRNRSNGLSVTLPPGEYVIAPMTFLAKQRGAYTLCVYSSMPIEIVGQEKVIRFFFICSRCSSAPFYVNDLYSITV